jgi:hypothetical protein
MMQAHPVPDVHARGGLAVEDVTSGSVAVLGAREGTDQIQLRAGIDDPADAAQNAIHLSKCSETIDVHGHKACGLQQKFLVAHKLPRNKTVSSRGPLCVRKLTQRKRNHALASSRFFARGRWSKLITASRYQFIAPARDEAPAVTLTPPPSRVTVGAAIPEAGMCGFAFDINSIPDFVRRA